MRERSGSERKRGDQKRKREHAKRLVLLGDHIKSELWLPSGDHVEPGEDPADTVRRECLEELNIQAHFHPMLKPAPLFITVTETDGGDPHPRRQSLVRA